MKQSWKSQPAPGTALCDCLNPAPASAVPRCDPEMIDFGLYGIDDDDCRRWVSDHPTRADAETEMNRLLSTP